MINNYLTIAFRHLSRNKVYSLISIAGLAVGFACVLWIGLYVKSELSYDNFVQDANRVYRVNMEGKMGDNEFYAGYTPPPAGAGLMSTFPEVESYTRIYRPGNQLTIYKNDHELKSFNERGVFAVDSNFLQVLTYPLKEGNAKTCLADPNSIVITEQIAKKYFGDTDPVGKLLTMDVSKNPFKVTGVIKDVSQNSSLRFDMLIPVENCGDVKYFNWSWVWLNIATYVKLKSSAINDPQVVQHMEARFPAMMRLLAASAFKRIGQPYDEFLKKGGKWNLHLQPLKDIHLKSGNIVSAVTDQGDIKNLYIFSAIAVFIILLACVNFINLSTAQSAKRAKEIGVRKVIGSGKGQLIKQFLIESLVFSFLGLGLAFMLIVLLIPMFNQLAGKLLTAQMFFTPAFILTMLVLVIVTALLAGSYPAFHLSSFKPVAVLKGVGFFNNSASSSFIRNGLVVFQFTISTALIVCTLIVYLQIMYIHHRDLGFDKENVIVLANAEKLGNSEETFRQEIAALPQVKEASLSTSMFTRGNFGDFYVPSSIDSKEHVAKDISLNSYLVDQNFISTLGLQIIKGRGFDRRFNDSLSVVINETTARQIGWKNPIGQLLRYPGGKNETYTVIGVVKDFNMESLHTAIQPFALFHNSSKSYDIKTSFVVVKLKPGNPASTLSRITDKWKHYNAENPLEYSFLNEDLNALYIADQGIGSLLGVFTAIAIFVACIGLFGLIAYTAERRTKEIGIRKVLGASVTQITMMLSKDFVQLVLVAILIASPIAWYAMNKWLENFAYHIVVSWWVFLLAGVLAIIIAFSTVSYQSIKAALVNPAKSLKTE